MHPPFSALRVRACVRARAFVCVCVCVWASDLLERVCWEKGNEGVRGGGGCSFYIKNKNLKYLTTFKFINKNVFLCHN